MSDLFTHPDQAEIVSVAFALLYSRDALPANSLAGIAVVSPLIDKGRELFLNVFVQQALDQLGALGAQNKAALAEKAADYARKMTEHGVDLAIAGLADLKAALGLP